MQTEHPAASSEMAGPFFSLDKAFCLLYVLHMASHTITKSNLVPRRIPSCEALCRGPIFQGPLNALRLY